jgi:hypothetical protein
MIMVFILLSLQSVNDELDTYQNYSYKHHLLEFFLIYSPYYLSPMNKPASAIPNSIGKSR